MYKQDFVYKVSASTDSGSQKIFYIIVFASVLMAMLFGMFAVTANPIIISFAIALIVGVVLSVNPVWIIWLILSLGLLVTGLLPLHFDFITSKAAWGVSLLGFLLMLIALVKVVISSSVRKDTPAFVWIALVFLLYAVANSLAQWNSIGEFLTGFKRYFQIWGLLFALCWIFFDKQEIHWWKIFVLFVALMQLPFALYERIIYVPIREGLQYLYPRMVPIDVVSGTFGATLTGGGASADMAIFLIIILAFLLARWREKVLPVNKVCLFVPIILAPLLLGETKAVILMLPLMFLIVYRQEMFVRLHYWLMGLIFTLIFIYAASYAYLYNVNPEGKTLVEKIEETVAYNFQDKGHGELELNRSKVLIFWVEQQGLHDPVSFFFGNGLGSSHEITGGHVARRYPGYGIGLTAASTLLWDLGIFGFILFITILVSAWRSAEELRIKTTEPEVKADAIAIQAALALFAFSIFYRLSLLEFLSIQIVFTLLLGYLAWLHHRYVCTN
ncbi:hypothetical protein [Nitrosomonas sp.]|uniref:hypothetical protein n=1 Tax=Nitrosomonas sp. TaxID=42353 RepID=UPI0027321462|nr:hypothetical protein [Nitrosomonas sp.]MDP1788083.1 hypothetical protein [Nitrosomonas sp.]